MKTFKHTIPSGEKLERYFKKPHPFLWLILSISFFGLAFRYDTSDELLRSSVALILVIVFGFIAFKEKARLRILPTKDKQI